jgi:hypothetical protein
MENWGLGEQQSPLTLIKAKVACSLTKYEKYLKLSRKDALQW